MKSSHKIALLLFSICPLISSDDTDIGKFGHIVVNGTDHTVHIHLDISGGTDAQKVLGPNRTWRSEKSGNVNAFEIRDYESGILIEKVPPTSRGQYKIVYLRKGANHGKFKGQDEITRNEAASRYNISSQGIDDRF